MHDLRKKALLESKKTSSRKARSKDVTPATSKRNTPATSRATSRNRAGSSRGGSDDELDAELSDETSFSVGSIDEIVNGDRSESGYDDLLADRIEEIFARKGSTNQGREKCYKAYVNLLTVRYSAESIAGKEDELVAAFLKSVKEESSEKETVLALKAIAITLITSSSDTVYDIAFAPLKRIITDSASTAIKSAAIHALGISNFYGGAATEGILETMDFFLEIVSSDGHMIFAPDEPEPVVAALEEWGFLCTLIEDMSEQSQDSVDTFVEQLDSSETGVQIAAAENIALLYEKSFKEFDPDEDVLVDRESVLSSSDENTTAPKLLRLYPAYRRTDQLLQKIESIVGANTLSVHHKSKRERKELKTNLKDVANSIEFPHRGPKYSNAFDKPENGGDRFGSRMKVKIHSVGSLSIDMWWHLHRLSGLRRVLQGGFVDHYEKNEVVFQTLPILIERKGARKEWRDG